MTIVPKSSPLFYPGGCLKCFIKGEIANPSADYTSIVVFNTGHFGIWEGTLMEVVLSEIFVPQSIHRAPLMVSSCSSSLKEFFQKLVFYVGLTDINTQCLRFLVGLISNNS
jgi:hypothetical protein